MEKLQLSADRSVIKAGEDDLSFITVKVTDKNGLIVPRSNPVIHFSIEGPGEIVATDNGDATCLISFQSHDRPAFNGMALVIIKVRQGTKGKVIVKASSEKLVTGQTTVNVQ
jgi:beta-galactosidase